MALYMHGHSLLDPWLSHSLDNVLHFVQALLDQPRHQRAALAQIWEEMRDNLEKPYRWARVRGPMGSAIATLWDWGFEPTQLDCWTDPSGAVWAIDLDSMPLSAIREVLLHHFKDHRWKSIVDHMENSLPVEPDLKAYKELRAES